MSQYSCENPTLAALENRSEVARKLQSFRQVKGFGTLGGRPRKSNVDAERENRKLRKALANLTDAVLIYLHEIEGLMLSQVEGEERGRRMGQLSTALDVANDRARFFALGVDYRNDNKGRAIAQAYRRNHQ